MYRRWPARLGRVEICPLQLPGRENRVRQAHYGTYEALAEQLAEALPPYLDRPYGFFGHCGGVLPGFETALALVERGQPAPAHFFVSSQVAPHEGPYGRFLRLSRAELGAEIRGLLRATSGGEPMPELIELYLEVLIADVEANKRYRKPAPVRLPCPITVVGWTGDAEVSPGLMGGWSACGEARFLLLEGDHYAFLGPPEPLLVELRRDMERAVARSAARAAAPGSPG
jgi:surfactin synthase thioesterase subunit